MAKREAWRSSITELLGDKLSTHGTDQTDIIRHFSFEESVYFVLMGSRPSETEAVLLRSVLNGYISHGITPQSTITVLHAADCGSSFIDALVAGFLVGAGQHHQGALNSVMMELPALCELSDTALREKVLARIRDQERMPGYGHRFFKRDPRAVTIMQIADERNFTGRYIDTARRLEAILSSQKQIFMNMDGAAGSVLLELGFDARIAPLFFVLGRSAMQAAAYLERLRNVGRPFSVIEVADIHEDDE